MASPALTPRAPLGAPLHRAARAHRRRRASKTNVRARAYPGGGGLQSPRWFIPERDLDLGDVGDDVEDLQLALGVQKTDGIYGRDTAEAVEAWQVMNGLAPTGYFGPKSRAAFIMNSEPISGLAAPARLDLAMAPTSSAPPPSVVASPSHVPAYVPVYVPSQTARGVGVANGGGAPMMNVASTGGGGVVAALVVGAAVAYAASERAAADGFLGSAWRSFLGAIRGDVEDDAYYPPGRAGVAAAAAAAEEEEARFRTRGMGGSFPLEYAYAANEPRAAAVSVDAYEYASARQPVMAASSGGGGGGGGWVREGRVHEGRRRVRAADDSDPRGEGCASGRTLHAIRRPTSESERRPGRRARRSWSSRRRGTPRRRRRRRRKFTPSPISAPRRRLRRRRPG